MYSAVFISHVKRGIDAQLHILAEFLSSTAEWRRNPKPNFIFGHSVGAAFPTSYDGR